MGKKKKDKDIPAGAKAVRGYQTRDLTQLQEKTNLGGDYNEGVTSSDPALKERIERRGNFSSEKAEERGVRGQVSSQNEDSVHAAQRQSSRDLPEIADEKGDRRKTD